MIREFIEEILPPLAYAIGVMFAIGIFLLILAIGIGGILNASGYKTPSEKYFEQCIADGVKEYECYGMIYGKRR